MGIYNRDYIRDLKPAGGLDAAPVVKYLIIINVVVFVLQVVWVRETRVNPLDFLRRQGIDIVDPDFDRLLDPEVMEQVMQPQRVSILQQWFELDTNKTVYGGQLWRLLTHAFCHDRFGLYHIFINMLCLYWFGSTLEAMYGSREFLLFYLSAAVFAGLAFVGLQLYLGTSVPAIGASGAVMAVMMLYTMHFPTEEIYVFWWFPLQMRWLMLGYVIWDLHPILLALSGDRVFTGVANAAHLGGLAFGFLYARCNWHLESIVDRLPGAHWQIRRRPRLRSVRPSRPEPARAVETSRMDEVLRKIQVSGRDSLTDEERAVLEDASRRLQDRNRSANETLWLRSNSPKDMLDLLTGKFTPSDRKLRLFSCACCRHDWRFLIDQRSQRAVEVAEKYADGLAGEAEREEAQSAAAGVRQVAGIPAQWTAVTVARTAAEQTIEAATHAARSLATEGDEYNFEKWQREMIWQCDLLRHIMGNPFSPYPAPDHWPADVVRLAEAQYNGEDCSFALHDALLEAGHPDLAAHIRREKSHPRGCWVLDLLRRTS